MGSDLVTVHCRLSRCIPSQRGKVSPRSDPARLGLCRAMWTPSEPPAPLVRLLIVCILPADVLLNCLQAGSALLISSWNVVLLPSLQGSLIGIPLATSPSRKHVRKQSDYPVYKQAKLCSYPAYKQAKLCKSAQACSSGLAPTLQMCCYTCHMCAVCGEQCHYSSSSVACNVCSVTYHSKAPQPAQCSIKWSEVSCCCPAVVGNCLSRFGGLKDQGLAHMCLGADEALGKKFLAQEPPKSQPPSESPSPSPPKPSAPPAQPSTAPGPSAEALQQPQAQAARQLASSQPGASLPERRPQLWPSGGHPLASIPQLPGVLLPVAIGPLHMLSVPCSSMHTASSDGMFCCLRILTGLSRG